MSDEPDWLDKLLAENEAAKRAQQPRKRLPAQRRATNSGTRMGYAQAGLRNEADELRKTEKGRRNEQLNIASYKVGGLIQPGGLSFEEAKAELTSAALYTGLTERELQEWDLPDRGLRDGMNNALRDLSDKGKGMADNVVRLVPPPPQPPTLEFYDVEDGFWNARKSLRDIYAASLSCLASPWAVLACCAARALATVRPCVTLPGIIGGPGSLNWFGAITATSGGGKGAASATAQRLVKQFVEQRNTGSGEGIISAYKRVKEGDEPGGLHESIMFMVDEIDSLTAQTKRSGATTMSVLRMAFSGENLGFSYVNKNTPNLKAHTYRMTMIVSVQPARAMDLLGDVKGGTPQRFMWFPSKDERLSREYVGGYVEPLIIPAPREWQYPMTVQIPTVARDLIIDERVKSQQREGTDALDGHAIFVREKFAFALAVLDNRTYVTEEDWELSGIAAKVSDVTRNWVTTQIDEAKDEEAEEKGKLQGVSSLAADDEKNWRATEKQAAIARLLRKHLRAAAPKGLSEREWVNKLNSRDRRWFDTAVSALVAGESARYNEAEKRWHSTE